LRVTRATSHPIGNGKEQHAIVLELFSLVPFSHGFIHCSHFSFCLIVGPYQDREQTEGVCHICPYSLVSCTSRMRGIQRTEKQERKKHATYSDHWRHGHARAPRRLAAAGRWLQGTGVKPPQPRGRGGDRVR